MAMTVEPEDESPGFLSRISPMVVAEFMEISSLLSVLQLRPGRWSYGAHEFESVVFATSCKSLIDIISTGLEPWKERGWRDEAGEKLANFELWVKLYDCLRGMDDRAVKVQFCYIDEDENMAMNYLYFGFYHAEFQWAEGEENGL